MNKLLGFFELKKSGLPCVNWKPYLLNENIQLDDNLLWTVRTAVIKGDDLNLPRTVGVTADKAHIFAKKQCKSLGENGMVVIYPYFIAQKSGTLMISENASVVEAVHEDLWNLVTENKRDITLIFKDNSVTYDGDERFFTNDEIECLKKYISKIKRLFRKEIISGDTILLEWSFAYNTNVNHEKIGDSYLVFYEARTLQN